MITQEQQKQGAELMKTLVEKAWESATFKDQLIKNPVATIESVTGNKMDKQMNFIVEDQSDKSTIYLNIPHEPKLDEIELSEKQLEVVAGGVSPTVILFFEGVSIGVTVWAALNQK